jgi:hypothetical protein
MAGKVPRMRVPVSRQIIGTKDIRLEPSVDTSTARSLVGIFNSLASQVSAGSRIVTYIATGSEGIDFRVPISFALSNAAYEVAFFGIADTGPIPDCAFPTGAGDRTTASFRVQVDIQPPTGQVIKFQLLGS